MPDATTTVIVIVALSGVLLPLTFLVVFAGGMLRRRNGVELDAGWSDSVAFLGGSSLGAMYLVIDDPVLGAPFVLVALGMAIGQWRAAHRTLAGLLVIGAVLPWTLLWAAYLLLGAQGLTFVDPVDGALAFVAGAAVLALAITVVLRDRAVADVPVPGAVRSGRPVRSFNTIGQAMREPSQIGPFGAPETAALVVLVVSGLALMSLAAFGLPLIVAYALNVVVTAALATEAYLRAMAPRTRRSMEAFMWLGAWEAERVRATTGERIPVTRAGAARWLSRHPASASDPALVRSLRVDLSLLAGRIPEARDGLAALPDGTPLERFEKAAASDVVAWWTRHGDALEAMEDAVSEIGPGDDEVRLRAEVGLAVAQVRHLAVADPAFAREPGEDPLQPLLDVRERLGSRADGQVRRILWPRIYRVLVFASIVLAIAGLALGRALSLP